MEAATPIADRTIRSEPALLPPGVPAGMNAVLALMLAKEPASRYQRCTDVLSDIRAIRDGLTPGLGKNQARANSL